eukprot:1824770-Prymnesium_polylepis.1
MWSGARDPGCHSNLQAPSQWERVWARSRARVGMRWGAEEARSEKPRSAVLWRLTTNLRRWNSGSFTIRRMA